MEHPHPLKNQLLERMNSELHRMEETGDVDIGFLERIAEFRDYINKIKTRWLENNNTEGFYFYQAARNMDFILDEVDARFQKAKKTHDNPAVALDTLALLPEFDKTLDLLEHDEITPESIDTILDRTRILRNVARSRNLIESIETDRKFLDTDMLGRYFTALMDQLSVKPNPIITDHDDE